MTLTEKVAYLKGLVEGIGVDETTNQGKIMKAVLDVLDDMAFTVSDLEDSTSELYEELEAVDEDLSSLEDEIYGTDEDEDEDDECDDDCCCDDDDVYEVKCPNYDEEICIDGSVLDKGEIQCPNCGETLTFEFEDDDDCGCGCECDDHCDCDK